MPAVDPFDLIGKSISQKYGVSALVAEGTSSLVYRATHLTGWRPVAVKVYRALADFPAGDREDLVQEFAQEAMRLGELADFPAVCQAHDAAAIAAPDGTWVPVVVLDWVEGITLEAVVKRERARVMPPRAIEDAVRLLDPAVDALARAHDRGDFHGDLKPRSFLLRGDPRDASCEVKLLNLGLAGVTRAARRRLAGLANAATGAGFDPSYGAPEHFAQITGALGPWTDVYSLALVVSELVSGERALQGTGARELCLSTADPTRRPTPRRLGAKIAGEVEAVFARALSIRTSDRYTSIGEFWGDLRDALWAAGESRKALPPSSPEPVVISATRTAPVTTPGSIKTPMPMPRVRTETPSYVLKATIPTLPGFAAVTGPAPASTPANAPAAAPTMVSVPTEKDAPSSTSFSVSYPKAQPTLSFTSVVGTSVAAVRSLDALPLTTRRGGKSPVPGTLPGLGKPTAERPAIVHREATKSVATKRPSATPPASVNAANAAVANAAAVAEKRASQTPLASVNAANAAAANALIGANGASAGTPTARTTTPIPTAASGVRSQRPSTPPAAPVSASVAIAMATAPVERAVRASEPPPASERTERASVRPPPIPSDLLEASRKAQAARTTSLPEATPTPANADAVVARTPPTPPAPSATSRAAAPTATMTGIAFAPANAGVGALARVQLPAGILPPPADTPREPLPQDEPPAQAWLETPPPAFPATAAMPPVAALPRAVASRPRLTPYVAAPPPASTTTTVSAPVGFKSTVPPARAVDQVMPRLTDSVAPASLDAHIPEFRPRMNRAVLAAWGAMAAAAAAGLYFVSNGGDGASKHAAKADAHANAPTTLASATVPAAAPAPACPAGMAHVPGGRFFMGSDEDMPYEKPAHHVTLAPYCIDINEVTTADYKTCSDRGDCKRAGAKNQWPGISEAEHARYDGLCNIKDPEGHGKHPINCVDWDMANIYCASHGERLPTEAEWEFAARGSDGRRFPWGDSDPTPELLNACDKGCLSWAQKVKLDQDGMFAVDDGWPTTAPVGSFPKGKSPFGLNDMAGNVWEWVGDWYAPYTTANQEDPHGPETGDAKVIRGGGWNGAHPSWVRPAFRYKNAPDTRSHGIGFRCVKPL